MSLLTHQPRWLLLSIFLVLWSWSSGLRRDSNRPKALGLGAEAHLLSSEDTWEERRQMGMTPCVKRCAMEAGETIGCGDTLNFACVCHSPQFMPDAVNCMTTNCSPEDKATGQALLMAACRQIGTSVSLPISFSGTHTSITSGVPPIFSSSPPQSASGSTQATITVTVTTPPSSFSSGSDPAPSTLPVSPSTTSSSVASSTSGPSAPPASGLPTTPPSRPETTVLETSTVSVPPTPTGPSAGGNGARAVQAAAAFASRAAAALAALAGMAFVL